MKSILTTLLIGGLFISVCSSQSAADSLAIIKTAENYVGGWAKGNTELVSDAVSPELVKRKVYTDDNNNWFINEMNASLLVYVTRKNKEGLRMTDLTPDMPFTLNVEILDITGNVASVKAWNEKYGFLDYCHMAKIGEEWTIINVLWEMLPKEDAEE